jgi:hypothetical protein
MRKVAGAFVVTYLCVVFAVVVVTISTIYLSIEHVVLSMVVNVVVTLITSCILMVYWQRRS